MRIEVWRVTELHYSQVGAGGDIPYGRDPEITMEVLRLKILPGVEIKVVRAPGLTPGASLMPESISLCAELFQLETHLQF